MREKQIRAELDGFAVNFENRALDLAAVELQPVADLAAVQHRVVLLEADVDAACVQAGGRGDGPARATQKREPRKKPGAVRKQITSMRGEGARGGTPPGVSPGRI